MATVADTMGGDAAATTDPATTDPKTPAGPHPTRARTAGGADTALAAPGSFVRAQESDQAWGERYRADHEHRSREASAARKQRVRRRRAASASRAATVTENEQAWADFARVRRASRQDAIERRLTQGYVWHGGPVGGNYRYPREPFRYHGLVSHEHPIVQLFVAKLRRVRQLLVGDDKAVAYTSDSKLLALDAPYCEDNKVCCASCASSWTGSCPGRSSPRPAAPQACRSPTSR